MYVRRITRARRRSFRTIQLARVNNVDKHPVYESSSLPFISVSRWALLFLWTVSVCFALVTPSPSSTVSPAEISESVAVGWKKSISRNRGRPGPRALFVQQQASSEGLLFRIFLLFRFLCKQRSPRSPDSVR